jgi:hypothetical protein
MEDEGFGMKLRPVTEEDLWINLIGATILMIVILGSIWVWDWLGKRLTGRP